MPVDSFKYLPGSIANYYRNMPAQKVDPIPFTPLAKPIEECRFALVTTAGVYNRSTDPPFDVEREKREPMWGDPTYRRIPRDIAQEQVGVSHLHINPRDIEADVNVTLPVHRFLELEAEGAIGSLGTSYSFMGYQVNNSEWRERYAPAVAGLMKDEAVDAALLTPA